MTRIEKLADRVLRMQTPDKLLLAAKMLVERNDVDLAKVIIQRALDELELIGLFDKVGKK
jgi:hypothetical protein